MYANYQVADHCRVCGVGVKPPHITTQSAELYRRLTPYRTLAHAIKYLSEATYRYGEGWGYSYPVRVN